MAESLHLRVFTPERQLVDTAVESLVAEGALGQFGVLPKHIAFLTSLEPGILVFRSRGAAEERIAVKGGYAEVREDAVTILADEALRREEVKPGDAEARKRRAKEGLEAAPFGHPAHERARRELAWAEVIGAFAAR